MTHDYFEFFTLPRNLNIEPADLEKKFHELSRKWHPDKFARRSTEEKEESLEASAILNDAYRTLKDPIKRAQYLLKQEGFEIGEQGSKEVPPELLEEVFELNEALEEADLQQLEIARRKFEKMQEELDKELKAKFAEWDQSHNRNSLTEIRGLLNRRKYITNLIAQTNVPNRV